MGLRTQPNALVLGERTTTLSALVQSIADVVEARARNGANYGVVVLAEGWIEHVAETAALLDDVRHKRLSAWGEALLAALPASARASLLAPPDDGGATRLSDIESESLLAELVARELAQRRSAVAFKPLSHFLGYQARSASVVCQFDLDLADAYARATLAYVRARPTVAGGAATASAWNDDEAASRAVVLTVRGLGGGKGSRRAWTPAFVPLTRLAAATGGVEPTSAAALAAPVSALADSDVNPGPLQIGSAASAAVPHSVTMTHGERAAVRARVDVHLRLLASVTADASSSARTLELLDEALVHATRLVAIAQRQE